MQFDLDSAWISGELALGVRLRVADGRVAAVERIEAPGNGWHALPGFVNAHCHLDLSSIAGETLDHATFADWIGELLPRRGLLADAEIDAAVLAGARALLATGTVAVGDIDSFGRSLATLRSTPLEGVAFRELVGRLESARLDRLADEIVRDDREASSSSSAIRRSLSPHAPYSTSAAAFAAAFAAAGARPVASHLAETSEEEELLLHGRGPLAELYRRLGFSAPTWSGGSRSTATPVFDLVPPAGHLVVVHGNRLTRDELERCASRGWPLVYCPRSHRYFGHPRHPSSRFVALGGILALGTDSRASNLGLDLWAEMACFRAADRDVADAAILAAATSGGRRALKLEPAELAPGQTATFQLVRRGDGDRVRPSDLVAAAVRGEFATGAVFVRGRQVHGGDDLPTSR